MKVGLLIGSESDIDIAREAASILKKFSIPFSLEVTSAHRSPDRTVKLIKDLEADGVQVFIAAAGKSAHLAGVVAAHTVRPVIGVPVGGSSLNGLDALFSTVQMPKGIPVACMGIGKSGGANAALLAVQILSLKDPSLEEKLKAFREETAREVEESSKRAQDKL